MNKLTLHCCFGITEELMLSKKTVGGREMDSVSLPSSDNGEASSAVWGTVGILEEASSALSGIVGSLEGSFVVMMIDVGRGETVGSPVGDNEVVGAMVGGTTGACVGTKVYSTSSPFSPQ